MNIYLALTIVFGFFAIGDILGVLTKAKMSSVFVALMLFMVAFMAGIIPPDIIEQSQLTGIAKFASAFLVFNMGSSVNIQQMIREWKILLLSVIGMGAALIGVICIIPIIGREAAFVSIPIINGGIVAAQIMTTAAMDKGFALAASLGTMLFAVSKFVGTVPASRFGLAEAKILVADFRENKAKGINLLEAETAKEVKKDAGDKVVFWKKHEKYYTNYTTLAITAAAGLLAAKLAGLTGIASSIWSLILGMVFSQLGLIPPRLLDIGKSSGMFMVATFCTLIPSLANISIADLSSLGIQIVLVFAASLAGIFIIMYLLPTWKLVGSRNLAMGTAMSQFLGFPATFLIVNEVATAVAETPEEKDYIVKKLTPAFVISGFVSVTTLSIFVAGVFAGML